MQINVNMRHLTLEVKQLHVAHYRLQQVTKNRQQVQLSAKNIKSVAHATNKRSKKKLTSLVAISQIYPPATTATTTKKHRQKQQMMNFIM